MVRMPAARAPGPGDGPLVAVPDEGGPVVEEGEPPPEEDPPEVARCLAVARTPRRPCPPPKAEGPTEGIRYKQAGEPAARAGEGHRDGGVGTRQRNF